MKSATIELTEFQRGFLWGIFSLSAKRALKNCGLPIRDDIDATVAIATAMAARIGSGAGISHELEPHAFELMARFESQPWPNEVSP